jgi:formate-dependent phosphoribosylglycinamide formyltransferase (GAR transformylase)
VRAKLSNVHGQERGRTLLGCGRRHSPPLHRQAAQSAQRVCAGAAREVLTRAWWETSQTKEDLEQECGQFGKLLGVHVQTSGANAGDAFVYFKDTTEAAAAYRKFNGRKFDGRTIAAAFTTVDNFATLVALAASAAAAAPAASDSAAPVDDASTVAVEP